MRYFESFMYSIISPKNVNFCFIKWCQVCIRVLLTFGEKSECLER